ncbi:hypothetical protein NDU88_004482 [Pleurodeles waltl]|uniref:Uncharacterized protein n=1 Tax=Pleurodeles waltl TaxID=8319 RepID=A0AAV7LUR6_PLEWA|nr:hypothetical protein NDU88_004482 [Pleurodeles waltl]
MGRCGATTHSAEHEGIKTAATHLSAGKLIPALPPLLFLLLGGGAPRDRELRLRSQHDKIRASYLSLSELRDAS